MKKILGNAVIIENKRGELLLHLRDEKAPSMKNQWCLLGGHVDENSNETPEEAAVRELKEEIGVEINPKALKLFKKIHPWDNDHESYIYNAVLDLRENEIVIGEGREVRFFSKDELLDMLPKLGYTNPFLEVLSEFIKR